LGNSQLLRAKRSVSILAAERDSSQVGSSVASTIQGQNTTPSSLLNNTCIADSNQCKPYTLSSTHRWSINTPTCLPGTSSRSTTAPGATLTWRVISSSGSAIVLGSTPLSVLENLPAPISKPEARAMITNPLRTGATENHQTEAVAIATAGGVYMLINGLCQSQHPLIWSGRHHVSWVCTRQTPGAPHVEQTAMYESKRLGHSKLCNGTRFESIC
jgi:hypothetical protein